MGEIFLAKHGLAGFEKLAVIKKVLPHLAADEQFISRFVDEAQVAIKLQHVNIAQVFEVGRVGDEYFLALEYVDGRDLRRTLALLGHRQQRLPVDLALFIARELANGLAYAHRRTTPDGASLNLVHCDISPPNVLVSFEGETKVIDFGIAKSAMRGTATDPKIGFGKFGYMAPEQLLRGGVVDYRTDLYAAGVVLFELLTGTRLYAAGPDPDYRALAKKVMRGQHLLPSTIDPRLAPYDALVATALRPGPEDRYQSAAELRDAIQQCLVAVNPTISTDQLGAYMRRLFADEMTAQHELHQRVASAHLSDFEEQFHTQTIATVSFALAPLEGPEATGRRRRVATPPSPSRTHTTGGNPVVKHRAATATPAAVPTLVVKPSPAFDTMALPTGPMEPLELRGADAAPEGAPEASVVSTMHLRRVLVIATSAVVALVAGAGLWGLVSGDRIKPASSVARADVPLVAARAITVEPIPIDPVASDRGSASDPGRGSAGDPDRGSADDPDRGSAGDPGHGSASDPGRGGASDPGRGGTSDPGRGGAHAPRHDLEVPGSAPAVRAGPGAVAQPSRRVPRETAHRPAPKAAVVTPAPFTREQLGQKYQQVRREYDDYKAKFGSRLEREWGELATFIQYMPASDDAGRKEAARRLDAFRGRMRE